MVYLGKPEFPVFGKAKMTTFERYFIADKTTHQNRKSLLQAA